MLEGFSRKLMPPGELEVRRAVERRRAERNEIIENVRVYFRAKAASLPLHAVYLVGSVARGDFNLWSDIDVVIVADGLPRRFLERVELFADRPPGIEIFPYSPEEFQSERARRNAIVLEACDIGIDLLDQPKG
jgi:predicted nucleotidyltransferase